MMTEMLEELCSVGASFHRRGYAFGSTGNISVRIAGRVWITPTGASLENLHPDRLACLDLHGTALNANRASKEYPFHLAAYRATAGRAAAIVHLHSTYSVALSCVDDLDDANPVRPFTPYYLMRVAPLAVLPYFRPGSEGLARAVESAAAAHNCMLLRNHGSICMGASLSEAVDRTEELEETAKLFFLLQGQKVRYLNQEEQSDVQRTFHNR
jgi:ribulose-5-phosphate 4-epimerase/fuculose-1-phosphate aldolase